MQPVLDTDRLRLAPVTPDDLDRLWTLWKTPEVRRFLWDDRAISREEAERTLSSCADFASRGLGLWTIGLRNSDPLSSADGFRDAWIGCAGLMPVSVAAQYAPELRNAIEPVVALMPVAWGNGYGTEALRTLVDYAFDTLRVPALAAVTDAPNVASEKMVRKAGFVFRGEHSGPIHMLRVYACDRDEMRRERSIVT